jgi:sugar phosphate isomerase/epimerase
MLKTLHALGFDGPIVVEPWNAQLRAMRPADAIAKVKFALDRCLEQAGI